MSVSIGGGGFSLGQSGFSNILDVLKVNGDIEAETASFTGDVEILGTLTAALDATAIANLGTLLDQMDFSEVDLFRITNIQIVNGEIVLTYSDGTSTNLGSPGTSDILVQSVYLAGNGDLIVALTDGTESNIGQLSGSSSGIVDANIDSSGDIVLDFPDGTTKVLEFPTSAGNADQAFVVTNDQDQEILSISQSGTVEISDGNVTPFITDTSSNVVQITNIVATEGISNFSDRRIKDNIQPPQLPCLETVKRLNVCQFNRTDIPNHPFTPFGFIAQEVEAVVPEFVHETPCTHIPDMDTVKSIRTYDMVPLLIKSVQELACENEDLKERLSKLETFVQGLHN